MHRSELTVAFHPSGPRASTTALVRPSGQRRERAPFVLVLAVFVLGITACGVPPSEECERYLECQAHHDEILDRPATDTNIFQPDGTCWENEDLADNCSDVCDARVLSLKERLERSELDLGPCA